MDGKRTSRIMGIALAGVVVQVVCLAETEYVRERYDLIVERSPFGVDPTITSDTTEENDAATEALAKNLRLCFLLESEDGEIRAGFQNLKAKKGSPASVTLIPGESFGNMKLLDVDLQNSWARLQYAGKSVFFPLKEASVPSEKPADTNKKRPPSRRLGGGFRRTAPPPEVPEKSRMSREEMDEHLKKYQMEAIRSGLPPLPVPLSKEMDDQLVAEGVLPPTE